MTTTEGSLSAPILRTEKPLLFMVAIIPVSYAKLGQVVLLLLLSGDGLT